MSACGAARQDAYEPKGDYRVAITAATFPAKQVLAQRSVLRIAVRNVGSQGIPDVAVTITTDDAGAAAQAFAYIDPQPGLAARSRPIWVLDDGPAGGQTAASNTWALGALPPGRTTTFTWHVTAVKSGHHVVHYRVSAGLNGKAKAVLSGGGVPAGDFDVTIDGRPQQAIVDEHGKVTNIGPAR